jgi:hypothetical protein
MGRTPGQVTVTTTATLLLALNPARTAYHLVNTGTVTVYLGGSNVTTSNGHALLAGTSSPQWSRGLGADTVSPVYGIVASGTALVTVEQHAI